MYSRSERAFYPKPQTTIGPTTYSVPPVTKLHQYAPFSSLSERVTAVIISTGPSPAIYGSSCSAAVSKHNPALFGRSRTRRFIQIENNYPDPGKYSANVQLKINGMREEDEVLQGDDAVVKKGRKPRVGWRRKHGAPSIPNHNQFGYMENEKGELEPRIRPQIDIKDPPAHLSSFTASNLQDRRGFKFAKQGRTINDEKTSLPGPSTYDSLVAEQYLLGYGGSNQPSMTSKPSPRFTEEIIQLSIKDGTPGPATYNDQTPKVQNTTFSTAKISSNITTALLPRPGPTAYDPVDNFTKKIWNRKLPFGSSALRFTIHRDQHEASFYDIPLTKSRFSNSYRHKLAFGSEPLTPRFVMSKVTTTPLAAYNLRNDGLKEGRDVEKGGGDRSERFEVSTKIGPSPDRYDTRKNLLSNTSNGVLSSQTKRILFQTSVNNPAPTQYDIQSNSVQKGAFLSEKRFDALKISDEPFFYQIPDALLKKSYNVTFV